MTEQKNDQARGYQLSSAIALRLMDIFSGKESTGIFEDALDAYMRANGITTEAVNMFIKYGKTAKSKHTYFPQFSAPLGQLYGGSPESIKAGEHFLKFLQGMQE